jgi:hypothetical protein
MQTRIALFSQLFLSGLEREQTPTTQVPRNQGIPPKATGADKSDKSDISDKAQ